MLKFIMFFLSQAMVARGDLGAELPIEEVPLLQVIRLLMKPDVAGSLRIYHLT